MDEQPSRPAPARMRHGGNPDGDRNANSAMPVHFGPSGGDA